MKVKHIITTCGIILGGLILSRGASATVTYETSSDVQFTFRPVLSLTLSEAGFVIDGLVPGVSDNSNAVTATVNTNSSAGYVLSATVGNTTYNTTSLVSGSDTIAMMGAGSALASGTWGYTLDDGVTYGALDTVNSTILNKTVDVAGAPASGFSGTNNTVIKVGAYASNTQANGSYRNVMNFTAVPNVAARTVSVAAGTNVASVTIGGSGTSGSFNEGDAVSITATCSGTATFSGWSQSNDYGSFANRTAASTTYTVGVGDVTLTAYCGGES